ncbi:MAG: c-type cytochrome [Gallionella sp.]
MNFTKTHITTILSALAFIACSAFAADSPELVRLRIGTGDPVAGKKHAAICTSCHGETGMSVAPGVPNLAGQYSDYILNQIFNFQQGTRADPSKTQLVMTLSDRKAINDISVYFAGQNQMTGASLGNESGKNIYIDKGCINCHGEFGKGKPRYNAIFPIIGGQRKEYLVKQMNDFKTGKRSTDVTEIMVQVVNQLTDLDIENVAKYLAAQ